MRAVPVAPDQAFNGLDLLATCVVVLDKSRRVVYANAAAEHLLDKSRKALLQKCLADIFFLSPQLQSALSEAEDNNWSYTAQDTEVRRHDGSLMRVNCTVTPLQEHVLPGGMARLLLELQPVDQQREANRIELQYTQQQANHELVRSLAHEINNPLGGIRGAAQLLENELANASLCEYTQVIIQETDRLQQLLQRLLVPHRAMHPKRIDIHEILERVHTLLKTEYSQIDFTRDYDISLPLLIGDREQLIQSFLNIGKNAAQAMLEAHTEAPCFNMQSRVLRQVTIAKRSFRLAAEISLTDNGPGIDDNLRERLFYPLVSGRKEGNGLGLSLAQTFIHQHQGAIEFESKPGHTVFIVRVPLEAEVHRAAGMA